jgi:hypothetical protein
MREISNGSGGTKKHFRERLTPIPKVRKIHNHSLSSLFRAAVDTMTLYRKLRRQPRDKWTRHRQPQGSHRRHLVLADQQLDPHHADSTQQPVTGLRRYRTPSWVIGAASQPDNGSRWSRKALFSCRLVSGTIQQAWNRKEAIEECQSEA